MEEGVVAYNRLIRFVILPFSAICCCSSGYLIEQVNNVDIHQRYLIKLLLYSSNHKSNSSASAIIMGISRECISSISSNMPPYERINIEIPRLLVSKRSSSLTKCKYSHDILFGHGNFNFFSKFNFEPNSVGSHLRDPITMAVLELQESGRVQMLYNKWWRNTGACLNDEKTKEKKANSLGVANVGGIFVMLFGGLAIAVAVGVFEFVWHKTHHAAPGETVCRKVGINKSFP